MRLLPLVAVGIVIPCLVACVVQSRTERGPDQGPTPVPTSTAPFATQPMVVNVDTGQTMTKVTGGVGVGVFVEYQAGGHWHVSMTCDTNTSGQNCDFDLKITPESGTLTNTYAPATPTNPATLAALGGTGVEATALMTTEVASFTFDGTPGTGLTMDATVSGLRYYVDPTGQQQTFFFFVAKNSQGAEAVNGGFTGTLTDPLTFEPSTP